MDARGPRVGSSVSGYVTALRAYDFLTSPTLGPTTASEILAKMDETEKEFLSDLFEAKLKYVTTRPYWNEPQAKSKLY